MSRVVKLVWAFIGVFAAGALVFLLTVGIPAPIQTRTTLIPSDVFFGAAKPHGTQK